MREKGGSKSGQPESEPQSKKKCKNTNTMKIKDNREPEVGPQSRKLHESTDMEDSTRFIDLDTLLKEGTTALKIIF